jgi:O-antigen/teichoic acid export membrane protein
MGIPSARVFWLPSGLDARQRRSVLELGLAGMAMAAMYWLTSSADRWFVGVFRDQTELGLYSFGSNIGMLGLVLNNALTAAWFPEVTQAYEQRREFANADVLGREWARLASTLLLVWLAVASSGGDVIRLIANPRFHDSAQYVPWVAAGVFFYGVASLANTGLWVSHDMKPSAYWWVAGAIVSVALNWLLVPQLGATGAAMTVCASYALIAGGILWSAHRTFPLQIPWQRLLGSAALVLVVGLPMTETWHPSALRSLCLKLPIGLAVSGVVLYRSSPDWSRRAMAACAKWVGRVYSGIT